MGEKKQEGEKAIRTRGDSARAAADHPAMWSDQGHCGREGLLWGDSDSSCPKRWRRAVTNHTASVKQTKTKADPLTFSHCYSKSLPSAQGAEDTQIHVLTYLVEYKITSNLIFKKSSVVIIYSQ